MDGLLDELRNVLSGLSGAEAAPPSPSIEPDRIAPPEPIQRAPSAPPAFIGNAEPTAAPATSSDADFWKGNVLGWPASGAEAEQPATAFSETAPFSSMGAPEIPEKPAPPAPTESERSANNPFVAYGDQKFLLGDDAPKLEKPALEGKPFSLDTPFLSDDSFTSEPAIDKTEQPIFEPPPRPPMDPSLVGTQESWKPEELIPAPPLPPVSAPTAQSVIPIPGTLTNEAEPPAKKMSDAGLELDKAEVKPSGFVQIACFFREGHERAAQQFVGKLKELADKSKAHLKIEPVFLNAWSPSAADSSAWIQSAKLSGADLMFVLAPKVELDAFRSLTINPIQTGIRVRLIAVEQIALRTLYMDILIELERGR